MSLPTERGDETLTSLVPGGYTPRAQMITGPYRLPDAPAVRPTYSGGGGRYTVPRRAGASPLPQLDFVIDLTTGEQEWLGGLGALGRRKKKKGLFGKLWKFHTTFAPHHAVARLVGQAVKGGAKKKRREEPTPPPAELPAPSTFAPSAIDTGAATTPAPGGSGAQSAAYGGVDYEETEHGIRLKAEEPPEPGARPAPLVYAGDRDAPLGPSDRASVDPRYSDPWASYREALKEQEPPDVDVYRQPGAEPEREPGVAREDPYASIYARDAGTLETLVERRDVESTPLGLGTFLPELYPIGYGVNVRAVDASYMGQYAEAAAAVIGLVSQSGILSGKKKKKKRRAPPEAVVVPAPAAPVPPPPPPAPAFTTYVPWLIAGSLGVAALYVVMGRRGRRRL